jgi:hypothetical protein
VIKAARAPHGGAWGMLHRGQFHKTDLAGVCRAFAAEIALVARQAVAP